MWFWNVYSHLLCYPPGWDFLYRCTMSCSSLESYFDVYKLLLLLLFFLFSGNTSPHYEDGAQCKSKFIGPRPTIHGQSCHKYWLNEHAFDEIWTWVCMETTIPPTQLSSTSRTTFIAPVKTIPNIYFIVRSFFLMSYFCKVRQLGRDLQAC